MVVASQGHQSAWSAAFAGKQPHERSWTEIEPEQSLRMIAATGVGAADSIIDVGGGAAHLVDRVHAAGYLDLSVLDLAPAALAEARERLGDGARVTWISADVLRWSPARPYALWHDRAVFHFLVQPDDRATYVDVALRAVAPGGHLVVATFAPHGPEACSGLPSSGTRRRSSPRCSSPLSGASARRRRTTSHRGGPSSRSPGSCCGGTEAPRTRLPGRRLSRPAEGRRRG